MTHDHQPIEELPPGPPVWTTRGGTPSLRDMRRTFWLWLATFATGRALDACEMPDDEDTIRKIHDSTKVWL